MAKLKNPVLPGFHPDPSMIRVGDTYYLANSTFEWWPGVAIYESRDLAHWRLAARPLDRVSQLDMVGCRASEGIWAPCLSYADGLFWLVYTNVRQGQGIWDTPNYVVTAPSIEGPWSEPVYLNSIGFDPSLFHDADGRKWFVSMASDHRPGRFKFGGIILWEYDAANGCMRGEPKTIWRSTHELSEGPHLFRHEGWYYLFVAYGGTGLRHSELCLRARSVDGPYEPDPRGVFLTSRYDLFHPLQKAGHASLVDTRDGRWFISFLCARPIPLLGRCTLGRETGIAEVAWEDGWPRLRNGDRKPDVACDTGLPEHPWPQPPATLPLSPIPDAFLTLREPLVEGRDYSLTARPGWLRLFGGSWLTSRHCQRLLARRMEHFHFEAETLLDFAPAHYKHMAGLICYYDYDNWYYLHKTRDERLGIVVSLIGCRNGQAFAPCEPVAVGDGPLRLAAHADVDQVQFLYAEGDAPLAKLGLPQELSILSDEHCRDGSFTGAMVGVCCHDLLLGTHAADFAWFCYEPCAPHEFAISLD